MASTTIPNRPVASTPSNNDLILINQSLNDNKIDIGTFQAWICQTPINMDMNNYAINGTTVLNSSREADIVNLTVGSGDKIDKIEDTGTGVKITFSNGNSYTLTP